jgi:hypothetical protein
MAVQVLRDLREGHDLAADAIIGAWLGFRSCSSPLHLSPVTPQFITPAPCSTRRDATTAQSKPANSVTTALRELVPAAKMLWHDLADAIFRCQG